jgi:hypothetical protein
MSYKVVIDDNFHYQDETESAAHGVFATADDAIMACKAIVNGFLADAVEPGMSAADLYSQYTSFGDDPFVVPLNRTGPPVTFSSWDYARDRCQVICKDKGGANL